MKHGKQTMIAKKIGVTSQLINQIIKGKRAITWDIAKGISALSGLDASEIMEKKQDEIIKLFEEMEF